MSPAELKAFRDKLGVKKPEPGKRRDWTPQMVDALFFLREVEELTWREIGIAFDDEGPNCCTRYNYYSAKRRTAELRAGNRDEIADLALRGQPVPVRAPKPEPVIVAPPMAAAQPVKARPARSFQATDNFVLARIERQGVTAGMFGDPLPGRSALDKREGRA